MKGYSTEKKFFRWCSNTTYNQILISSCFINHFLEPLFDQENFLFVVKEVLLNLIFKSEGEEALKKSDFIAKMRMIEYCRV